LKIKIFNWLLIIDILTILLILAIVFIPSSIIRIIIGLPLLLYFPGYIFVAALFPPKKSVPSNTGDRMADCSDNSQGKNETKRMDGIERVSLSFGLSIAISALIGLGLNYTPWGIRLVPILISISIFIIFITLIALVRMSQSIDRFYLTMRLTIKLPGWEGSALNKALTVILAVAIISSVAMLTYLAAVPKVGERFSEFYILGNNYKAEGYPSVFFLKDYQVIGIQYGDPATTSNGGPGKVILGIINQEQRNVVYSVAITVDGQPSEIYLDGKILNKIEQIDLQQGEKWEQEVGFIPRHAGDNQKIEFSLYIDDEVEPIYLLHLWVNVKASS
jgi:uncharacterized membrane protein